MDRPGGDGALLCGRAQGLGVLGGPSRGRQTWGLAAPGVDFIVKGGMGNSLALLRRLPRPRRLLLPGEPRGPRGWRRRRGVGVGRDGGRSAGIPPEPGGSERLSGGDRGRVPGLPGGARALSRGEIFFFFGNEKRGYKVAPFALNFGFLTDRGR